MSRSYILNCRDPLDGANERASWSRVAHDCAMSNGTALVPGRQAKQTLEAGWVLAEEERWDATADGGSDLASLRLHAPRTLALEFRLDGTGTRLIEFTGLAELHIDGDLQWAGEADLGWEVLDTSMSVAESPRQDGLVVYVLELPQAILRFASGLGSGPSLT